MPPLRGPTASAMRSPSTMHSAIGLPESASMQELYLSCLHRTFSKSRFRFRFSTSISLRICKLPKRCNICNETFGQTLKIIITQRYINSLISHSGNKISAFTDEPIYFLPYKCSFKRYFSFPTSTKTHKVMNIQPSSIKNKGYTNKQNKELEDLNSNKHRQKLQEKKSHISLPEIRPP